MPDLEPAKLKAENRIVMLTLDELSALFKVHKNTIRRWRSVGKFPEPIELPGGGLRWRADVVERFITSIDPGDFVANEE